MLIPPFKLRNLSLLAMLLGNSFVAHATTEAFDYNLPAQPAARTLNHIAKSSKTELIYADNNLQGVTAAPVKGRYTAQQAMDVALGKTDLSVEKVDNRLMSVKKVNKPAVKVDSATGKTLATMTVTDKAMRDVNAPDNKDYKITNAVTATKTDTPIMQTPMSIKVVPRQVLRDQQTITVDQALRNVSGAVAGAGGTGTFFLRGFGNSNVYRDGFLNQSQWAHTEDLANIERVEVLKGPGSILYGRSEPGGLVNFVTKSPLDTPYYSLNQQFGSFDLYRTNIDATGPLTENKDLAYRFNLGYQTNRTFQQFGGDERLFIAPSLRWNISDQTTSTLKVEYSDIKQKGNGTVPLMGNRPAPISRQLNLGDPWNRQEDEYVMVSLNTEHNFNENWKLRHRFNFSNHTLTMTGFNPDGAWATIDPLVGDISRSFFAQNTDGKDYQHNFFNAVEVTGKFNTGFAKHTLLMGGDYYRADYRSTMAGFGANPNQYDVSNIYAPTHQAGSPVITATDVTTTNATLPWLGLYMQDQIELPYNVHLLGGFRYDHAETNSISTGEYATDRTRSNEDKVSPRGGIVWQPIPELSVYGSYTENFGASNTINRGIPLPPQTAQQWETGIKTELFGGRFTGTIAYFDLKKKNLPVALDALTTKAVGQAESKGLELDITGEILSGWNVIGAYAYTPFAKTTNNGFDTDPDTGLPIASSQNGKRLNNAPKNSGSLWTTLYLDSEF